jgi:Icc-related predicted phosphoesterase
MPVKTGRKEKDALIKDGFNRDKGTMSKAELVRIKKQAKLDKAQAEMERLKKERALERLSDQIGVLREKVSAAPQKLPEKEDVSVDGQEEQDVKSAYQMLEHLRYAYRNSKSDTGKKGKQRLVELMEKDAEFKFMIRELVKVEASLLSAKIKSKEDPAQTNNMVFVVLKGLEDEKKVMASMGNIDMKQIDNALNPNATPVYEADEKESMDIGGQSAPEGW